MQLRAIFQRKEACFEPSECEIEKVIHLSDSDFARFQQTLLDNYDFLRDNADLMRVENGITHCLLVVGETFEDGILVNSEGSDYARYAAYFPKAKQFLLTQEQELEASSSAAVPASPALLAYGEKMSKLVDASVKRALMGHDQATYILSMTELQSLHDQDSFDEALFAAMLRERPEILDMDVDESGDIMVTLSLEAVMAYDLSKYRVLTQDELDVMYARHILFNYSEGGEQADFSNCRLTDLDMRHMQLNGACFAGALLENVKMQSAGLCFCVFKDAQFVDCDMTDSTAEEADFSGAAFTGCTIRNGVFTHSNFANAQFQDTDLWKAYLGSCCIEGARFLCSETGGIDLSGATEDAQGWVMGGM